jgi:hypothetical protein
MWKVDASPPNCRTGAVMARPTLTPCCSGRKEYVLGAGMCSL